MTSQFATHLPAVLDHAASDTDAALARLFELIRIPSVSTDPAYAADCQRCAEWLAADLASIGFDASVRQTTGHPMVVAHDPSGEGPHVLFYGHYDVQPVDPLNLWNSDPFEPVLVPQPNGDTQIVARGASDDKGQLMTFVEACRAWKAVAGKLPIRVSIIFEGEEESGSPSLPAFLEQAAAELKADVVLICDTDMWDATTPAITTMLRGIVKEEFEIAAAARDLHSGIYGNAARNPLQVVSDIIASLRAPDGSVALPGFYDGVGPVPDNVKARWKRLPFDEKAFLGDIGLSLPAGEQGFSLLEQVWARPSCEINGVTGGYAGEGFKTVIPSKASSKLSFRLVAGQEPRRIQQIFHDRVRAMLPADCSVEFTNHGLSRATVMPIDGVFLGKALEALTEEWETEAAVAGTGGSIPIATEFKERLGMDSLLIGFAQLDNRIHSPNEKYDLSSFRKGIRSWARILAAFAE
jgi:acetylornithine deacetylase/succinyl-diaminopimelate desuccinylase-like protein